MDEKTIEQEREQLAKLEAQFEAAGGRGVELADEIDELRRKIALHGRKFYRTVIFIEVLTEGPYNPESLHQIGNDINYGDASGTWDITEVEEIDSVRVAQLLEEQGSDPSFLLGDEGE